MSQQNDHGRGRQAALNLLARIADSFDTDPEVVASMSDEEVDAELARLGLDPRRAMPDELRQLVGNFRASEPPQRWADALTSVKRRLSEFAFRPAEMTPILLGEGTELIRDTVEIPLTLFFSEEVVRERLPWAGQSLMLARAIEGARVQTARYAVWLHEEAEAEGGDGHLVVALGIGDDERHEAFLDKDCLSASFAGESLPSDVNSLTIELRLIGKDADSKPNT